MSSEYNAMKIHGRDNTIKNMYSKHSSLKLKNHSPKACKSQFKKHGTKFL